MQTFISKTENRTTFKIKTGYSLELLMSETMKLLESTSKLKNKNGRNAPHLTVTEPILTNCNTADNDCPQSSRVLHAFVPHETFGQLLEISSRNFIFLKIFYSDFHYIEVWFTDSN